jgi:hypothetical protein
MKRRTTKLIISVLLLIVGIVLIILSIKNTNSSTTTSSDIKPTVAITATVQPLLRASPNTPFTIARSSPPVEVKKSAEVTMVLNGNFDEISDKTSDARKKYESDFINDLQKALNIKPGRIEIISIESGSIIVNFRIISDSSPSQRTVSEIVNDIKVQVNDNNSILRKGNITGTSTGNLTINVVEDVFDCAGSLRGTSVIDNCGKCGGDNSCIDCAGILNGTTKIDECGVCGGDNNTCLDCNGLINGTAVEDICGICGGDNSTCLSDDGCVNKLTGESMLDLCGVCGGNNECVDCEGVVNGTSIIDECGICGGLNATCLDDDCNFTELDGRKTTRLDKCGVCMGPNACVDCAGVVNGDAVRDRCKVCNGDNSTCTDCAGVVNGDAVVDKCGVCGGNNACIPPMLRSVVPTRMSMPMGRPISMRSKVLSSVTVDECAEFPEESYYMDDCGNLVQRPWYGCDDDRCDECSSN